MGNPGDRAPAHKGNTGVRDGDTEHPRVRGTPGVRDSHPGEPRRQAARRTGEPRVDAWGPCPDWGRLWGRRARTPGSLSAVGMSPRLRHLLGDPEPRPTPTHGAQASGTPAPPQLAPARARGATGTSRPDASSRYLWALTEPGCCQRTQASGLPAPLALSPPLRSGDQASGPPPARPITPASRSPAPAPGNPGVCNPTPPPQHTQTLTPPGHPGVWAPGPGPGFTPCGRGGVLPVLPQLHPDLGWGSLGTATDNTAGVEGHHLGLRCSHFWRCGWTG